MRRNARGPWSVHAPPPAPRDGTPGGAPRAAAPVSRSLVMALLALDGALCAVTTALLLPSYLGTTPFPVSALAGAALLTVADVVGRLVGGTEEIQVGIITAVIGAPFFIWIVRRQKVREL